MTETRDFSLSVSFTPPRCVRAQKFDISQDNDRF